MYETETNIFVCAQTETKSRLKGSVLGRLSLQTVQLRAGVRQGSPISPILFALYVDDILQKLEKSKLGCHVKYICYNAFMYANDLILISSSMRDLQLLVNVCTDELSGLNMLVHTKKSKCLKIGVNCNLTPSEIVIDNTALPWSQSL